MSDTDILALAYQNKAILITVDKDFGDLIFYMGKFIQACYWYALKMHQVMIF